MFTLETYISDFQATIPYATYSQPITSYNLTLRWGSIQTDLELLSLEHQNNPKYSGAKRLLLQITQQQIQQLLNEYAFGLFIQSSQGKFFSLLNLNSIQLQNEINFGADNLVFYDNKRSPNFTYQIKIKISQHNPRVPKSQKTIDKRNVAFADKKQNKISFLYGNRNAECARIQPAAVPKKNMPPKVKSSIKQQKVISKPQNQIRVPKNPIISHQQSLNDDVEQSTDYCPPMMEFTNQPEEIQIVENIPKIHTITNYEEIKSTEPKQFLKRPAKANESIDQTGKTGKDFQKDKKAVREELREMALREAEEQNRKKQGEVMLPIFKGDSYELVPISSLTKQQIVDYAHRQKLVQLYEQEKKQLEKEKEAKAKKKQQRRNKRERQKMDKKKLIEYEKQLQQQYIGNFKKKHQKEISQQRESQSSQSQISEEIKESYKPVVIQPRKDSDQQQISGQSYSQFEDEYSEDFQSVSNAGSLFKSRVSLQSSAKKYETEKKQNGKNSYQISDISQSLDDYGYSQQFDSFSQSHLSRNKRAHSISEVSGSFDYKK